MHYEKVYCSWIQYVNTILKDNWNEGFQTTQHMNMKAINKISIDEMKSHDISRKHNTVGPG
jgi:hypothetical protein